MKKVAGEFPSKATRTLVKLLTQEKASLFTPDVVPLSMAGGYLTRAVKENIACKECFSLMSKPKSLAL